MLAVIKITLYDPKTSEIKSEHVRAHVAWGILKRVVKLMKKLDPQNPDALTEEMLDEVTALIADAFDSEISVHDLEKYADIGDMMTVLNTIVSRAEGILPNQPPRAH